MSAPALFFLGQPLALTSTPGAGSPLPTEFKLFSAGENASVHGSVLFDARAAELVMAQAARHGVDFMIDLEHRSLVGGMSENDSDARGWFRPALRGGELWAIDVTWTEDGEVRLRKRRQRYTSPAFWCDEFDDATQMPRVTSLINAAICAMPATYQIAPLVASANARWRALDDLRPSVYAPIRMSSESTPAATATETPAATATEPPQEPSALSAAERAELEELRAERAEREQAERRSLVTALVELGAETPATAWSSGAPVARLASEPLDDLRSRVAALRSHPRPTAGHTPPPAGSAGATGEEALEDFERRDAAKIKDPEARARFVASRLARKQKALNHG